MLSIYVSHKALLFVHCSLLAWLFRTSLAEKTGYDRVILLPASTVRLNLAIDFMVSFHNEAMFTVGHSRLSNTCFQVKYI
ncbi:hypothetical protein GGI42DRAFT_311766 [Trichoderma sp. SZMC 28013]